MSTPFNPARGLIIVAVRIEGPTGHTHARVALDTGATTTVIAPAHLVGVGYDPATAPHRLPLTTGSGVEYVARLPILKLVALGQERLNFEIVAHTLPPSASVDGLLGLDFLRNQELTVDFRTGQITLR